MVDALLAACDRHDDAPPRFLKMGHLTVHPKYLVLLQHNGLTDLSSVFRFDGGERLDKAGLDRWRERRRFVLSDLCGGSHTFYVKRYERPPVFQQVRRILSGRPRESTAGREWHAIARLAAAGIPVPERVAFGQQMCGWVESRSFLMLAAVRGRSLECWLPEHWQRGAAGERLRRQRQMIRRLAAQVAAFHAAGFVHRDLYASHIFLVDSDDPGDRPPLFVFIDLQRVFRPRWRRTRWVVKDLAALSFSTARSVSQTDRLRFWREYTRCVRRPHWTHTLPHRIEAKAGRMRRRHERRTATGT